MNKFESERHKKKLALTTNFFKSKGELPGVINSVFLMGFFFKIFAQKVGGGQGPTCLPYSYGPEYYVQIMCSGYSSTKNG